MLTRIMTMAVEDHQPPPLVRGRRVKLKYAHAGGYNRRFNQLFTAAGKRSARLL